jgi:hypothetical protein
MLSIFLMMLWRFGRLERGRQPAASGGVFKRELARLKTIDKAMFLRNIANN